MRKNQFLKVKNSLLELEKDFIELKDRELKRVKVEERQKSYFLYDMDEFEEKEMKKIRPIKSTWYD